MKYNPNILQIKAGREAAYKILNNSNDMYRPTDSLSFYSGWMEGRKQLIEELNNGTIKPAKSLEDFGKDEKVKFLRKRIAEQREYICWMQEQDYEPKRKNELIKSATDIKSMINEELMEMWDKYKNSI